MIRSLLLLLSQCDRYPGTRPLPFWLPAPWNQTRRIKNPFLPILQKRRSLIQRVRLLRHQTTHFCSKASPRCSYPILSPVQPPWANLSWRTHLNNLGLWDRNGSGKLMSAQLLSATKLRQLHCLLVIIQYIAICVYFILWEFENRFGALLWLFCHIRFFLSFLTITFFPLIIKWLCSSFSASWSQPFRRCYHSVSNSRISPTERAFLVMLSVEIGNKNGQD